MSKTAQQFDKIIEKCQGLFEKKMQDYGTAWRILRLPSLTDQLFIKASRIRSIQEKKQMKVQESIDGEFVAIINYSAMALIQLELGTADQPDLNTEEAMSYYKKYILQAKKLMQNKNHDYGEAWRDMRLSSITDMILQKILRIKQIEDNQGKTLVSEGLDANYFDMLNYAVFALILLEE
ncbi:MAG: DUF1599 domain-containing protein [Flavobacteriales bacterium]